jgi:acetoin utilization deacetylase AcuC-like enzyme
VYLAADIFIYMKAFYHPDYFLPLPMGHPFPMEKFPQAAEIIARELKGIEILEAQPATWEQLLLVHTEGYLDAIHEGLLNAEELVRLGLPWQPNLLHRSALETGATLQACAAALEDGLACNLAGGTHHAFADRGLGYCVLNDVAVAIRELHLTRPRLRVIVIDTDAHQGNGTHAIFREDARVFTYSIHVGRNYPSQKEPGSCDVELPRWVEGSEYLQRLEETLLPALQTAQPELIIWIAGADNHALDRFGQMKLSTEEMQQRDENVLRWTAGVGLPTAVLYGGGYHLEPGMTARLHAQTVAAAWRQSLTVH